MQLVAVINGSEEREITETQTHYVCEGIKAKTLPALVAQLKRSTLLAGHVKSVVVTLKN